jgi:ParB family chromosome partitioning protein
MIPIMPANIVIRPNRQRQEFDPEKLQELADSIEKLGLLHPPVVRRENYEWILVAGERRLRAMSQILELGGTIQHDGQTYYDAIPCTEIGELSILDAEEAELDENLKRADLTWQEHAAAVARLHRLRSNQRAVANVEARQDELPVKPAHTVADTAQELLGRSDGAYQDSIRQEIIVSKHLDNPAVAGAKSVKEAMKILKAQEQRAENVKLAAAIGASFSASSHDLVHGDCLTYMRGLVNANDPDLFFDVICTDPPYGMGADSFGDAGGKLTAIEHHYDDSLEAWTRLMQSWCNLSYAVCKPQAHAYVFCDIGNFFALRDLMHSAGWYVFRTPFIVVKRNSGRVPLPETGPRRQWECLLYAVKGKKHVTHIYPDVIEASADENLGHGAQKPVSVYQNLLQRSVRPGDRVADFFAGTGPVFPAAHSLRCFAVGVEQDAANFAKCARRIEELRQLEQPDLLGELSK